MCQGLDAMGFCERLRHRVVERELFIHESCACSFEFGDASLASFGNLGSKLPEGSSPNGFRSRAQTAWSAGFFGTMPIILMPSDWRALVCRYSASSVTNCPSNWLFGVGAHPVLVGIVQLSHRRIVAGRSCCPAECPLCLACLEFFGLSMHRAPLRVADFPVLDEISWRLQAADQLRTFTNTPDRSSWG